MPLLTLSIGLVKPDLELCINSHVAALATDAKKEAKRYQSSHLFVYKEGDQHLLLWSCAKDDSASVGL